MEKSMNRSIFFALFVSLQMFATPAFAGIDLADRAAIRQEARIENSRNLRIVGQLMCRENGATAAGTCNLAIRENGSGTVYQLIGSTQKAMQLYTAGNTRVTVRGTLGENQTVAVNAAEAN